MRLRTLAFALLGGCMVAGPTLARTRPTPTATSARDIQRVTRALRRLPKTTSGCRGLVASFKDGNGFHGITRITIQGCRVEIVHTARGNRNPQLYKGRLTKEEARRIVEHTLKLRLWKVRSRRRAGIPDETRPTIEVGVTGVGLFRVTLWAGEGRKSRAFSAVQSALLAVSRRVSRGRVTY